MIHLQDSWIPFLPALFYISDCFFPSFTLSSEDSYVKHVIIQNIVVIHCHITAFSDTPELQKVTQKTMTELDYLHPYTLYSVYVTAHTGRETYVSNVCNVTTFEDGKYTKCSINTATFGQVCAQQHLHRCVNSNICTDVCTTTFGQMCVQQHLDRCVHSNI